MPPHGHEDASGGGGAPAASPPKPAPTQQAKGKGKMNGDDLSEEDLKLKARLEQYVVQVESDNPRLWRVAIGNLRQEIRAATSSMTSVPKPLIFLRAHFGTLKAYFESNRMRNSEQKRHVADILSVLAFTMSAEGERESLKYCMMGSLVDICSWGHGYVRNLAFEIGEEQKHNDLSMPIGSLIELVLEIVTFLMKHNAETEALDLLIEVGWLEMLADEKNKVYLIMLLDLVDSTNYKRACLYLTSCSKYLSTPDNVSALRIAFAMYMKVSDLVSALRIVLLINDSQDDDQNLKKVFAEANDFPLKLQFAYMIARYVSLIRAHIHAREAKFPKISMGLMMEIDNEMATDENERKALQEVVYNTKLSEGYHILARDIGVMEPKSPEDIYKDHLIDGQGARSLGLDSARQNLVATFVNAFVNAGFCQDKLMTTIPDSSEDWVFKNKELGQACAAASLGMVHLWDPDSGFGKLKKYLQWLDDYVVAGVLLGIGIVHSGVKNDSRGALYLIGWCSMEVPIKRIGAILGLGIAYAGSRNNELKSHFSLTLRNSQTPWEDLVFSSISMGLVFVGSCNEEIAQQIISVLRGLSKSEPGPIISLLPVALGLLYLGKQEMVDAIADKVSKTFDEPLKTYCGVTVTSLAYAGTGNVLKVQRLLLICSLHHEKGATHLGPAVLGIALISMAEELGAEMAVRSLKHLLQYGDAIIRRAVPLALGMLCISNPKVDVVDTLRRLSHDSDDLVKKAATISLGLIGAGTNNARIAGFLRELSVYAYGDYLFCVRIAQGLVHIGKGLLTLDPYHSDRLLVSPVALAGLVIFLHTCLNIQSTILGEYPYLLYILVLAMQPRMLLTVDEELKPLSVPVRVGQAVDVVGKAGSPRTITGARTHNTPVLLAAGERAELTTEKYVPLTPILEGFVILRKNPGYHED